MVETSARKRFFHVSARHVQNTFPELAVGQTIEIGNVHNAFFGYYERPLNYVVHGNNGNTMTMKAIHYLNAFKQGAIQGADLPGHAHGIALHYLMLARELIMEEVRKEICPDAPSRQSCLWLAPTIEGARRWQGIIGANSVIYEIQAIGNLHRADANLLLSDSEALSVTYDRARRCWRGEVSENPNMEVLLRGRAKIIAVRT